MRARLRLIFAAGGLVAAAVAPARAIDLFGLGETGEASTATWAEGEKRPDSVDAKRLKIHPDVVELLSERTNAAPRFLYGAGGPEGDAVGFAWPVPAARGDEIVRAERERFAKSGYAIFLAERNFGIEPDRIGVLPASDPFAPVVTLGTADPSGSVTNETLVAKLREWRQESGLELLGTGRDWIEVELARIPKDLARFTGEVRALAPAAVGEGEPAVDRFADEVRRTRRVYLWWR